MSNCNSCYLVDNIYCSDLDGTLIKGDITEGGENFMGVPEFMYEYHYDLIPASGLALYPTYADYSKEYYRRADAYDTGAYLMPSLIYQPSQDEVIAEYWESTISKYFVDYTKNYLTKKAGQGCNVWLVTGSSLPYVSPCANYIDIDRIVAVEPDKIISYGPGKIERMQELTNEQLTGVAGYIGDTWNNDGPIMTTIRNYNKCASLKYIYHNQEINDVMANLKKYNIKRVNAYNVVV
jgi:phosphoserine phosphatase